MTTETNFRKMLAVAGGLALAVPSLSACAEQAEDAAEAVEEAAAVGGAVAYGPTRQGDHGMFAIFIQGGVQFGLWQR